MAINLTKGKTYNFSFADDVIIGLGWDSAQAGHDAVDCDAAAILCGLDHKQFDVIYFGKTSSDNGAVLFGGDSRTGKGDGENEQILINFGKMPNNVGKIVIAVNIYDARAKRQHFGMINNAFVRGRSRKTGQEIFCFNLTDEYEDMTGIIAAEIVRFSKGWNFVPVGKGIREASRMMSIVKLYQ